MATYIDITGQRFGRLTAIRMVEKGSRRRSQRWLFRCDDGNEIEVDKHHVMRGATRSCGCLNMEMRIERGTIHGHSAGGKVSSEYHSWCNMHSRCSNPNDKEYKNYGARGITVCERWNQFENFLADMGLRPSPRHQIDRIDNDGNYQPGNVRWATSREQQNNKRTNHLLTVDGQTLTIMEWARETNINRCALRNRIKRGWHSDWVTMPFPGMVFYEG